MSFWSEFWEGYVRIFALPLLFFGAIAGGLIYLLFGVLWPSVPEVVSGIVGLFLGCLCVLGAMAIQARSS